MCMLKGMCVCKCLRGHMRVCRWAYICVCLRRGGGGGARVREHVHIRSVCVCVCVCKGYVFVCM